MPNHFTTICLCGQNYSRLEEVGKDEVDLSGLEGSDLCSIVSPMPEELEGIVAMSTPCRYRHKKTGEFCKDCNGPPWDEREEHWEQVNLSEAELYALISKYGATDWYVWKIQNHGTKWGTYSLKTYVLGGDGSPILIEFQSAWRPPNPQTMRKIEDYLAEKYLLKNFRWLGHNPYDNSTVDIEVAPTVEKKT